MITWRLWRMLLKPPEDHPLFQRMASLQDSAGESSGWWVKITVAALFLLWFAWPKVLSMLTTNLVVALPLLLPLIVNLRGLAWAVRVGGAIASERERGAYDLLSVMPPGALGASWIISAACLHRHHAFQGLYTVIHSVVAFGALIVAFITLMVVANVDPSRSANFVGEELPRGFFIDAASTIMLFYLDYLQTVVLAVIVGMAVALYAQSRLDARMLSLATFLLIQTAIYVVAIGAGFVVLPDLLADLGIHSGLAQLSLLAFRVALLIGLREMVIIVLWRGLIEKLGGDTSRLDNAIAL
jgi:hypothetical protein